MIEWIPKIRSYINNLPETRHMFGIAKISGIPKKARIPNEVFRLIGSWKIPDSGGHHDKYANPNYIHLDSYPPIRGGCECGGNVRTMSNEKHMPTCTIDQKMKSRWKMWKARKEWIQESSRFMFREEYWAKCFGIPKVSVEDVFTNLNLNRRELYRSGWEETAETMMMAKDRGYSSEEVGLAYGVSRSTVDRRIREA